MLIFPVMGPGHVTTVTTVTRAVVTAGDTQLTYYHTHLLQNENNHKSPQKYCFAFGKRYCSVSYQETWKPKTEDYQLCTSLIVCCSQKKTLRHQVVAPTQPPVCSNIAWTTRNFLNSIGREIGATTIGPATRQQQPTKRIPVLCMVPKTMWKWNAVCLELSSCSSAHQKCIRKIEYEGIVWMACAEAYFNDCNGN